MFSGDEDYGDEITSGVDLPRDGHLDEMENETEEDEE